MLLEKKTIQNLTCMLRCLQGALPRKSIALSRNNQVNPGLFVYSHKHNLKFQIYTQEPL